MGPNAGYHAFLILGIVCGIGAFFVVMPAVDFTMQSRLKEDRPAWYRAIQGAGGLGLLLIAFYIWIITRFW